MEETKQKIMRKIGGKEIDLVEKVAELSKLCLEGTVHHQIPDNVHIAFEKNEITKRDRIVVRLHSDAFHSFLVNDTISFFGEDIYVDEAIKLKGDYTNVIRVIIEKTKIIEEKNDYNINEENHDDEKRKRFDTDEFL